MKDLESSSCWFNLWTVGLHLRITTAAASYANEFPASLATTKGVGAFSFLTSRARLLVAAGPAGRPYAFDTDSAYTHYVYTSAMWQWPSFFCYSLYMRSPVLGNLLFDG